MRTLTSREFAAYKCVDCVACELNKKRPNHGECMYDECPFFGRYTGLIEHNRQTRRGKAISTIKSEPIIITKAPKPKKVDIAYIMTLYERGEYTVNIAKRVKMRPQVVADIIKSRGVSV